MSIATQLLHAGKPKESATVDDDRPLIDRLHEETFHDKEGLRWIKDKYALRTLIRKAHCFTLDDDTSAMVADFSIAIATDLESARRLAIPPFPVTWIDLNNRARLQRIRDRGVKLAGGGAYSPMEDTLKRVGWLIYPGTEMGGFYAMYVTSLEDTMFAAPLAFWWHTGSQHPDGLKVVDSHSLSRLALGVKASNVCPYDAFPSPTPLYADFLKKEKPGNTVLEMMTEIAGELRHIWGFLIALGAGQLGVDARVGEARKHEGPLRMMKNGKPLLPLEHKTLHLHLAKRATVEKVIAKAITHHKNRWHEVRSHFRFIKKSGKRVPIKSHPRGDEKLGRVEKTYVVER